MEDCSNVNGGETTTIQGNSPGKELQAAHVPTEHSGDKTVKKKRKVLKSIFFSYLVPIQKSLQYPDIVSCLIHYEYTCVYLPI